MKVEKGPYLEKKLFSDLHHEKESAHKPQTESIWD